MDTTGVTVCPSHSCVHTPVGGSHLGTTRKEKLMPNAICLSFNSQLLPEADRKTNYLVSVEIF